MKLSKKIVYTLLPLMLIISVASITALYYPLKKQALYREHSEVTHHTERAANIYRLHQSYVNQALYLVENDPALHAFLSPSMHPHPHADIALAHSLQQSLSRILGNTEVFSSLAILKPDGELLYYYENSDDPFASIPSNQRALAKQLYAEGALRSEKVYQEEDFRRIVNTVMIDRRTASTPNSSSLENSVIIQVAVCLKLFETALVDIREQFSAQTLLEPTSNLSKVQTNSLSATAKLDNQYTLRVIPGLDYVNGWLNKVRNAVIALIAAFVLIVTAVFIIVLKRYGTIPLEKLTTEIQKVNISNWGKGVISGTERKDEIGILANRFQELLLKLSLIHKDTDFNARHDALTRLPNRHTFSYDATEKLTIADQEKDSVAIIYIDLDNFKYVNDRHGHAVGDSLLRHMADRINALLQASPDTKEALFGRLAGDEFAIALPTNLNARMVANVAQQILSLFEQGYHFERGSFPITASLGISRYPIDGHNIDDLISNADAAMYQAKSCGKNQYKYYSNELAIVIRRKYAIEAALKTIDFDKEFNLVYMPICDAQRRIISCETLLRWHSPEFGEVPAEELMAIAKITGQFRKVDQWVFSQTLQNFQTLDKLFGEHFTLAVNMASAELESTELLEFLTHQIAQYNIEPSRIELEFSSDFAVTEGLMSVDKVTALSEAGFQISIDDYGNGQTSLLFLVGNSIHKIKFGRKFVSKLLNSTYSTLLEPMISLCHSQGVLVTAVGIENEFIARYFSKAGCDYFQGYYYSQPKSLDKLIAEYMPLKDGEQCQQIEY